MAQVNKRNTQKNAKAATRSPAKTVYAKTSGRAAKPSFVRTPENPVKSPAAGRPDNAGRSPAVRRPENPAKSPAAGRPENAGRSPAAGRPEKPAFVPPQPAFAPAEAAPEGLLYGSNPVREALRKGSPITRVWISRERDDRIAAEIIGHCHKASIPFSKVDKMHLDRLCGGASHQGFAAQGAPKAYTPWRDMLAKAKEDGQTPILVVLDEVEDPHNLGAVLRSIDALGAHGAVIPKHRASPLTAGAARASAGAWEYVMVDRVTNIANALEEMKKEGLWIIGAAVGEGQPVYSTDWTIPVALVMGGENKDLSPLIKKKCDILVHIPMRGEINSLNVSAASAIILSEIGRQRNA